METLQHMDCEIISEDKMKGNKRERMNICINKCCVFDTNLIINIYTSNQILRFMFLCDI